MTDQPLAISVVIPVFNPGPLLLECLGSLAPLESAEVIVVDNGSTDGLADKAADADPSLRVLRNEVNEGFATACNKGVLAARGRYVLLMNSDAAMLAGGLRALLSEAEVDTSAAIWQPVILDSSGLVESAGEFFTWPGFFIRGRRLPGLSDPSYPVFSCTAACVLIRRDAFLELGGLRDRYFAYAEDVDLCWRARLAGWEVKVVPSVRVVHEKNVTSRRIFSAHEFRYMTLRNRWRTILANASFLTLVRMAPLYILGCLLASVALLVSGRWASAGAVVRAILWPCAHAGDVLAQRRDVSRIRKCGDREVLRRELKATLLSREGWRLFAEHYQR